VALMLLAMLNSTFLLIAILKYDCVKRTVPFETFWNNRFAFVMTMLLHSQHVLRFLFPSHPLVVLLNGRRSCEMDWRISYGAFTIGVPMFMAVLAQIGWITFHASEMRNAAAGAVSAVAIVSLGSWFVYTYHKWGNFVARLQQQS
jgi:calcium release-activated calcium channel protein 1